MYTGEGIGVEYCVNEVQPSSTLVTVFLGDSIKNKKQ